MPRNVSHAPRRTADIPGLEYAGEIDALGQDVVGPIQIGDRVFGIVAGGGQAEYVLTDERMVMPVPANLDSIAAAAVPEAFLTAHDALLTQGHVVPGERVLVHAAASGVGTAAVQLAHAMGNPTFGTTRSAGKLERLQALGLDHGIDTQHESFVEVIRDKTKGRGVDVVVDLIGAAGLADNLAVLAPKGRLVLVGLLSGTSASLDLNLMLRKRLKIVGTTLRARPIEEKIAATTMFAATVVPWLETGLVRPVVDSVFAFDEFQAAQARLESNLVFGKVILRL